ncbi:MAG: hypothetical protein ACE5IG_05575 [Dehalococcoidia bacterium]
MSTIPSRRLELAWSDFFELAPVPVSMYVPSRPGVYRLSFYDEARQARTVFHVDQAENLRLALREHYLHSNPSSCIGTMLRSHRCYFRYAKLPDQADREAAVRALFDTCKPQCTDPTTVPQVVPAEINFE